MKPEIPAFPETAIAPLELEEPSRARARAERLHRLVADHPDFEVLPESSHPLYGCRFFPHALAERRGEPAVEARVDRLNREIAASLERSGLALATAGELAGRVVLRFSIRPDRTRDSDLELTFDAVARIGRSLIPAALADLPRPGRMARAAARLRLSTCRTFERSFDMFRRIAIFAFGATSYLVFLGTFLYALGFVGGFLVPTTLDGPARMPFAPALAIDLGLLALFAVQHSVMARPAFKRMWLRVVSPALERPVYVLASSLCLIAMFVLWQPLGGVIWDLESALARGLAYAAFGFGWGLVLVTTFLINHFDLFGLRQVWLALRNRPYRPLKFVQPGPYKLVRHPLYVGWLFAFWATPTMTAAHLVFAIMTTAYILVAIRFEERDLVAEHGAAYEAYRRRVPMLVPGTARRASTPSLEEAPAA